MCADESLPEPDLKAVYRQQNAQYEALITCEDYQGNLLTSLNTLVNFHGAVVVDTGAGTGRLTRMLADQVGRICAFDISAHMLSVTREKMIQSGWSHWSAAVADHRWLPAVSGAYDVILSGWSFCYLALDNPNNWQNQVSQGLAEMQRVLRSGGTAIIIETLGTGTESPVRYPNMEPYFAFLEANGFAHTWLRTDYRFDNLEEARAKTSFFFGDVLVFQTQADDCVILPECTGIWWRKW